MKPNLIRARARFIGSCSLISGCRNSNPRDDISSSVHGKIFFTTLAVVVVMLAGVDIAFALDSIPTVVSLVRDKADAPFTTDDILVIYSSNIFAILGLRSLFFLLKGAVDKFDYLQQGIAIVLIFIGVKMLIEFFDIGYRFLYHWE